MFLSRCTRRTPFDYRSERGGQNHAFQYTCRLIRGFERAGCSLRPGHHPFAGLCASAAGTVPYFSNHQSFLPPDSPRKHFARITSREETTSPSFICSGRIVPAYSGRCLARTLGAERACGARRTRYLLWPAKTVGYLAGHGRGPRVLLLDEPTAGLSAAEVPRVKAILRSLARDTTVLMIDMIWTWLLSLPTVSPFSIKVGFLPKAMWRPSEIIRK